MHGRRDLASLKKSYEHLELEYDKLVELIAKANAREFGASSERIHPYQISLFNDMEATAPDEVDDEVPGPTRPKKKRKAIDYSALDVEVVEHKLSEQDRTCPVCKALMREMSVEVRRVVKLVPARFVVLEHRRHVYVCEPCSKASAQDGVTKVQIRRAKMPVQPLGKSFASASLKSRGSLPQIRARPATLPHRRRLTAHRYLHLTRQSVAGWVIGAHERWLGMIYTLMRKWLLAGDALHIDETTGSQGAQAKTYEQVVYVAVREHRGKCTHLHIPIR